MDMPYGLANKPAGGVPTVPNMPQFRRRPPTCPDKEITRPNRQDSDTTPISKPPSRAPFFHSCTHAHSLTYLLYARTNSATWPSSRFSHHQTPPLSTLLHQRRQFISSTNFNSKTPEGSTREYPHRPHPCTNQNLFICVVHHLYISRAREKAQGFASLPPSPYT